MVQFKSWRDAYIFLRDYANFSCLNCDYSNHNLDTTEEHSDSEYVHLFCTYGLDMVRLDFQFVCTQWKKGDLDLYCFKDARCHSWKLPRDVIDIIEEDDEKLWSIEDIEKVIRDYESKGTH